MNLSSLNSDLPQGHNDTESPAFENHTKGLILKAEANILRIDSQIRDLICQREQESETVAKLRTAIAPIRKVPAELLAKIFSFTFQTDFWKTKALLLQFSGVCVFWRQIIQNTPRLYTNGIYITGNDSKRFSERYMTMLQTWLAKSVPLPIPIRIRGYGTDAVLKSLLPSANRWSSLQLACTGLPCLADLPPGYLQMLESLDLMPYDHEKLPVVKAFLSAHRLRRLTLCVRDTSRFPMPWSQLTSLEIVNHSAATCREILTKCTKLVEAEFTITIHAYNALPELPIAVLPRLESLFIVFLCTSRNSIHFFQPLSLPALRTLTCRYPPDPAPWPQSMFTDFQLRSPNIEHFHSINCPMCPDDLIAFLRHAPALRELDLKNCSGCVDSNLWDMLRYREGDVAPLVPALENLGLTLVADHVSPACIEDVIMSRWWSDEAQSAMAAPPRVARWKGFLIRTQRARAFSEGFQSWLEVAKLQGLDSEALCR